MKTNLKTVSPVSEPAAFEEDVAAGNRLYLTWLCTPVIEREEETKKDMHTKSDSINSGADWVRGWQWH